MGSFQKRNVPNFAKFPFVLWKLASVVEHSGSTWCIQPCSSDLQIGKQAVGVCQREGRRHRGGLEGEGMRNKWRIVMQTEGISRDSFSLEAEIIHLCQRAQVWQCLGAESYCSSPGILQGMLPALAVARRRCLCLIRCLCIKWICWTFWKQTFCSNKIDCGFHFRTPHSSCKWFRDSVSAIPTHAPYSACFRPLCVGLKMQMGCRWWPWGSSQPWIALTILTWDLTHTLQPGALFSSIQDL